MGVLLTGSISFGTVKNRFFDLLTVSRHEKYGSEQYFPELGRKKWIFVRFKIHFFAFLTRIWVEGFHGRTMREGP